MNLLFVIIAMVVVGAIIGAVAGVIWKGERPIGVAGDYVLAIVVAVVFGILDAVVIPAMGFSTTLMYIALIFEPAGAALIALWLVRKAKRN